MEEAERLCDRVAIVERGRVIDIGTPAGLVRRHCPMQAVVLETADAGAGEHFQTIPGVDSISWQDGRCTIRGSGGDLVPHVIQCLGEHRIRVTDFRTELPNLEDVFLKLTGHSIRE
jgi:ABC-2 type transport system ATP-binding protein